MGEPESRVDHKSTNKLDNRKENLRLATQSQNMCNTRKRSDNTSGVKGVCWDASKGRWKAQIKLKGKTYNLGCFDSVPAAEVVVRAARESLHGAFSRHE